MSETHWPEDGIAFRRTRKTYAAFLLLFGTALLAGGGVLAVEGGSFYYLVAGLAVAGSGVLAWRADSRSAVLYGAILLFTVAWAVYESGFAPWSLVARLAMLFVLGLPLLSVHIRGRARTPVRRSRFSGPQMLGGGLALALVMGSGLHALAPARVDPLLPTGAMASISERPAQALSAASRDDWQHYGNDAGGTRFSPLEQITPQNVGKLQVAWEADLGGGPKEAMASLEVTPLNIGDTVYLCNAYNVVVALDAETGQDRWRYDMTRETPASGKPCRGVAYFKVSEASGLCAERIIVTNQTPELIALDAPTGKPCEGFGNQGRVRITEGLGHIPAGYHYVSSAPQIVRGKIVFGGAVMDGQYWGEPSGVIRAYDAVTGAFAWAFDVGRPNEHGQPAEGQTYTPATPNSWAPISADESLGLVYLPMGNATPDFFGGHRRPFDDQVSSAVVALDAETGAMRWHFNTVHHDLWDYDVPAQPTLVDLHTAGGVRKALIQPTKRGEVFVLDRATGEPIKEVVEKPTPQGGIPPGERLSPTQPFSTAMPSFRGPTLRESDMWGLTPIDQMVCRILFRQSRYEGIFTPVNLDKPTLIDPGYSGGINWGGVSVDVDRGVMLVNWNRLVSRVGLITREEAQKRGYRLFDGKSQGGGPQVMENTPYAATPGAFLSPLGVPCNEPPWGFITAVDLTKGQVIWNKPLGTGRDSGPLGIRSHLPVTMGVPNIGGSVATRSGLTFIGAATDGIFRAYDTTTGEKLWEDRLPGGGQATPMTYRSPRSGRQFVVIAAGGKPSMKTRIGTKVVAYALPQ